MKACWKKLKDHCASKCKKKSTTPNQSLGPEFSDISGQGSGKPIDTSPGKESPSKMTLDLSAKPGGAAGGKALRDFHSSVLHEDAHEDFFAYLPHEEIKFNPRTSRAVCVGVNVYEKNEKMNLGKSADSDAFVMALRLNDRLRIPMDFIEVFSEKSDDKTSPTSDNIQKSLRKQAQQAGEDGIVVLHITCHGLKIPDDKVDRFGFTGTLLTANYPPDWLTYKDIINCVKDTKVRSVVLILDACHSARVARDLCESAKANHVPFFVFASCGPEQSAMQWPGLGKDGHGLFTYFFTRALQRKAKKGYFPAYDFLEYLKEYMAALRILHEPGYYSYETAQHPELVVRPGPPLHTPVAAPSPDTHGPAADPPACGVARQDSDENDVEHKRRVALDKEDFITSSDEVALPGTFSGWMRSEGVRNSVEVLNRDNLFYEQGFRSHTIAFFAKSVVRKLYDDGLRKGQLCNPRTVLATFDLVPHTMFGQRLGAAPRFADLRCYVAYFGNKTVELLQLKEGYPQQLLQAVKDIEETHKFVYNGDDDLSSSPNMALELMDLDFVKPTLTLPDLTEEQWDQLALLPEER